VNPAAPSPAIGAARTVAAAVTSGGASVGMTANAMSTALAGTVSCL